MKDEKVKQIHDSIVGRFGLNKDRLLGYLYHLATTARYQQSKDYMCVWPVESDSPNVDGYEMGVFMKQAAGFVRSGIYFKHKDKSECRRTTSIINERIFDTAFTDALQIVETNLENKSRKEQDQFDKALAKVVSMLTPEQILNVDGCYEALSEGLNNQTMDVIEAYNANPGQNNLELKYTSKEIIEIMINDLEDLRDLAGKKVESKEEKRQVEQVDNTIKLARGYLENMSHIIDKMVQ